MIHAYDRPAGMYIGAAVYVGAAVRPTIGGSKVQIPLLVIYKGLCFVVQVDQTE